MIRAGVPKSTDLEKQARTDAIQAATKGAIARFLGTEAIISSDGAAIDEERRLCYVGITRAEEICTISFVGNRRIFGQWQSALP